MLSYFVLVFEVLSFMVSILIFVRKDAPIYLRFFPVFLFITVVFETIGFMLVEMGVMYYPMYNIFPVFEFAFYSFVLYHLLSGRQMKLVISGVGVLYTLLALTYAMMLDNTFHTLTYLAGAVLLVFYCMNYFYELFKSPVFEKPVAEPAFWTCLGLLIFYGGTIPVFAAVKFLRRSGFEMEVFEFFLSICNYFLYTTFAIAFVCFYKKYKKKPSNLITRNSLS